MLRRYNFDSPPGTDARLYVSSLLIISCLVILVAYPACARFRFEEGDWIAWGDARYPIDIEVGRNTIYVATNSGLLRWDRQTLNWVYPWFTVPGPMEKAIILSGCRRVMEDPLTLDLYVKANGQWFMRDEGTSRWDKSEAPSGPVLMRIKEKKSLPAKPPSGMIMPPTYFVDLTDHNLEHRLIEWKYGLGAYDQRNRFFYTWNGFGIGIADEFTSVLELYPGGPGPATALDITKETVWAASELDRENGWLWQRDRDENRWIFHHPSIEWGLEPGVVNRIRTDPQDVLWMATSGGLMVRKSGSWRHIRRKDGLPRENILDVAPSGSGAWIATMSGVAYVSPSSYTVFRPDEKTHSVLRHQAFYRLAASADTVWAAGAGLFFRHDPVHSWQVIEGPPSIAAATVPTALHAEKGVLAVGDRMGFAWRDDDGNWHELFSFRWNDGYVYAISYHRGYFWLGTDTGLVKYDPFEGDVIRYTGKDGLVGTTVYEIIPDGDWLWLGTERALVKFRWYVKGRID